MVRVFDYGARDYGSIPDGDIVFDASLLKTQHYKVWIKGKVVHTLSKGITPKMNLIAWVELELACHVVAVNVCVLVRIHINELLFLNKSVLICFHTVKWLPVLKIFRYFYLTHWWDSTRFYHSGSAWTLS